MLQVLPPSNVDWVPSLESLRGQYDYLREKHLTGEQRLLRDGGGLDPAINNPLSQEDASPWNRHFQVS